MTPEQIVPFLRSVVASGERISADDVDAIERSLSERPPVDQLREAAQALIATNFYEDDDSTVMSTEFARAWLDLQQAIAALAPERGS